MSSKIVLRTCLIGGMLLCLLVTVASAMRYPAILTPPDESIVFGVFIGMTVLGYVLIAVLTIRSALSTIDFSARRGLQWGALTGIFWLIEVLAGNLGDPHQAWVLVAYFGASAIAFGLPFVAALLGARSACRAGTGIMIGLWAGMIGAIMTFLDLMALTYLFMGVMQQEPDNIAGLQRSHAPDMATFLVGDSLAGGINHLLFIGAFLSGILGVIGGYIGAALATMPANHATQ